MANADDDIKRFGEKLRILRTRKGLTIRALASELRVSHGAIGEVEANARQPRINFARKVAEYFGVSADVLLDDERDV
jgi:repressor LexA